MTLYVNNICLGQKLHSNIYKSDNYSVFTDKVIQGENVAIVLSANEIIAKTRVYSDSKYLRFIPIKFSINQKDNENESGKNHFLVINENEKTQKFVFGKPKAPNELITNGYLGANYSYEIALDMTPVFDQFEKVGFYETNTGEKIYKKEFEGVYVAGNAEPLSWEYSNLGKKGLKLLQSEKNNIYVLTVNLNPCPTEPVENTRKFTPSTLGKPTFSSGIAIVDANYNLSLEEMVKNIEKDSTFRTGTKWSGVWTRDVSYSTILALAYLEPEVAKKSLLRKVSRDRIIQDTGSGGAWPVSSDRVVWAIAAWEIYKITGDKDWLTYIYKVIKNTLEDDEKTLFDSSSGLFGGESTFLDWREQTYPTWMNNVDIYDSKNLGTNVVFSQAYDVLGQMAEALDQNGAIYFLKSKNLKKTIKNKLWQQEKGYFGQYLYGRNGLILSPKYEALGNALSIYFSVADSTLYSRIIQNTPKLAFGVPCIYPQIPYISPYHNESIWPFVQAYWNLAAAKANDENALVYGIASIYRASTLFLTNYENMVASTGHFKGTEINSDNMLWSISGNLSTVFRIFLGMSFHENGIRFTPVIPKVFDGYKKLSGFIYRKALLDIEVRGFGNKIKSISIDGILLKAPFIGSELVGKHSVLIEMNNNSFDKTPFNLVENKVSLAAPKAIYENGKIAWTPVSNCQYYIVYKNNSILTKTILNTIEVDTNQVCEYKVSAFNTLVGESFTSEPFLVFPRSKSSKIEMENILSTNPKHEKSIEVSLKENKELKFDIEIKKEGFYRFDFRYANGSGPLNTDNKCAIRSLYLDEKYLGTIVFPQRGLDEWENWAFSNYKETYLKKGRHTFNLKFQEWNTNMNQDVNTAKIDYFRSVLIRE
ncbi:MAG: glycogen debranching protein [Bacteroidetes bacterium]|nr:MAG: glycogen debranching protein [Bacteroidota bacterium]